MSGEPATATRLTWPSQASGAQRSDHSGLRCPDARMPYPYAPTAKNAA